MSKGTKVWLIIAFILVVVGCVIFGGAMTMSGWDFMKLSTTKYVTNNYEISEDYKNISIVTGVGNVSIVPSEDLKTSVVCQEQKNMKHSVTVKDDTLSIEVEDTRKWYEHIGINFSTPKITVYVPQTEYGTLTVETSTGKVDLKDIVCENLISSGSTGSILLNHVIAKETFSIRRDTGNIKFDGSDANEIFAETGTGNITGTLLSEKIFIAQTDTGKIDVPKTTTGGKCEVSTDTGNIKLEIK